MRGLSASLLLCLGLLLLLGAGIRYLTARDLQRELQSAQDLRWNAEVARYAQQSPPMLPPSPPEPVALPDRNFTWGLVTVGQVFLACGGLYLLVALQRRRPSARRTRVSERDHLQSHTGNTG